ncbi:Retrovirus-related Pol polyprotein from type-1 retrotransposable element R1, partial [Stegodyphus mimosarum]
MTISINCKYEQLLITSIYCSPQEDMGPNLHILENIFSNLRRSQHVITGDFNAHHDMWHYNNTDNRGHTLADFIAPHNLYIHNLSSDTPTFETANGKRWPDLTLSTLSISSKIQEWKVLDDPSHSDHNYISFALIEEIPDLKLRRFLISKQKARQFGRKIFTSLQYAEKLIDKCASPDAVHDITETIIKTIQETAKNPFKLHNNNKNTKTNWWTKELRCEKQHTKALRRKMNSAPEGLKMEIWIKYKQQLANYKKKITEAKLHSWKNYCCNNKETYGQLYKMATSFESMIRKELVHETVEVKGSDEITLKPMASDIDVFDEISGELNPTDLGNHIQNAKRYDNGEIKLKLANKKEVSKLEEAILDKKNLSTKIFTKRERL